jgi:hypothetical protein
MKLSIAAGAALLAWAVGTVPGMADDKPNKSVCIKSYEIDRTVVKDDRTILFYMINRKVWKNTLINRCTGLPLSTRGFTYSPTNPTTHEICSNLQTIVVNDTGQVCLLGAFTPYQKNAASGSSSGQ